jgi:predicted CXXCH cytochrome family protein
VKAVRLILGLGLIFSASLIGAATHPVPLDKNTDSAKCIECHEDKAKGKNVHSAIAMGCTSCHEIRVNKDVTRVKLITTTPYALCLTCHADKNAATLKGTVHPPAVRDCVKCHDPHQSDNKFQLLRPTSGAKNENLCLSCHNQGVDVPATGSRHAALDMGCETCHVTHKTGEKGKIEFDYHLTKAPPALCIDCHDPKDASLVKAHQGQPFGAANCVQCHNPHQSNQAKLMQKFTHPPFADKQCDTCHAPVKDGKVVLTQSDSKALCVTCHSEQAEKIDKAPVQHPGTQGECIACHNPHAGKTPGFIQPDPVNACLACHSEQAEQQKKAHLHQPAFDQGCATCHEPHGGDNNHLLRVKDPNPLCLECHGPDRAPEKLESEHLYVIFNGKVKLQEDYFRKTPMLPLKYGMGHPTDQHPVSGPSEPGNPASPPMTCLTCHQPHSSQHANLLVKDQAADMAFCNTCHKGKLSLPK